MKAEFDISELEAGLDGLQQRLDSAMTTLAEQGGMKLESYAKDHAPWTDRTHQARLTLNHRVEKTPEGFTIYLLYGVDYGIWLELAHEKRFSIIPQTLNYVGANEIIPSFNNFMSHLRI